MESSVGKRGKCKLEGRQKTLGARHEIRQPCEITGCHRVAKPYGGKSFLEGGRAIAKGLKGFEDVAEGI